MRAHDGVETIAVTDDDMVATVIDAETDIEDADLLAASPRRSRPGARAPSRRHRRRRPRRAVGMTGCRRHRCHSVAMAAKKSAPPQRTMSKEHKAALAVGRAEGSAVRRYLDALEARKPKRGRRRTVESIQRRLAVIDSTIDDAERLTALKLAQERIDLQAELAFLAADDDLDELVAGFIEVALNYSERQGISYAAWREAGVPASVLRDAGLTRAT
jgi:hypothetical protein